MHDRQATFGLTLLADSGVEPLTVDEAKLYLRIDGDEENDLIAALISAARLRAEQVTGRSFTAQSWRLSLDGFTAQSWRLSLDSFPNHGNPYRRTIRLPRTPLLSVDRITYIDTLGAERTLPPSAFRVDSGSSPCRLAPSAGLVWPSTHATLAAVTVDFTAGYQTPADVPAMVKQAMYLMIASWYANREDTEQAQTLPRASESLLGPYKVSRVGFEVAC